MDKIRSQLSQQSVDRWCQYGLWLAIAFYVGSVLRLTFRWHDSVFGFETGFDLAIFDQAVWLISKGQTPFVTVRGLHILADHFSVVLYLVAPLYWFWESPKVLLTVQTVVLALGALPVYAIARERTQEPITAFIFSLVYLLYPAMQYSNTYEFHPDTLATPLFLTAFLYLIRQRWPLYFAALGVVALTKETVGLTIVLLGLYALLIDRRMGLLTVAFGLATLLIALETVRAFNAGVASGYYWLYAHYGNSLPAIIGFILSQPWSVLQDMMTGQRGHYLLQLLRPLLFLPLIAPEVLYITIPALLINLLSSRTIMHTDKGGYYAASITPFLFVAAIIDYSRLHKWRSNFGPALLANLCLWSMWATIEDGPLWIHHQVSRSDFDEHAQYKQRVAETLQILAKIPANASVSAQSTLSAQLSQRKKIYTFPNPFVQRGWGNTIKARRELETGYGSILDVRQLDKIMADSPVEYVVLCPPSGRFPLTESSFDECAVALLKSRAYGIIAISRDTVLLRRGANYQNGLKLLERQAAAPITSPQDVRRAFGEWVKLQAPLP